MVEKRLYRENDAGERDFMEIQWWRGRIYRDKMLERKTLQRYNGGERDIIDIQLWTWRFDRYIIVEQETLQKYNEERRRRYSAIMVESENLQIESMTCRRV